MGPSRDRPAAGIGFTVALLIGELAFDDPAMVGTAKTGALAASVIAAAWLSARNRQASRVRTRTTT